jgi:hypothetical protein
MLESPTPIDPRGPVLTPLTTVIGFTLVSEQVTDLSGKRGCEGPNLHLLHSIVSKSSIYEQNSLPRLWRT